MTMLELILKSDSKQLRDLLFNYDDYTSPWCRTCPKLNNECEVDGNCYDRIARWLEETCE